MSGAETLRVGDYVTLTHEVEQRIAMADRGDAGRVLEVQGDLVYIGWESGGRSWFPMQALCATTAEQIAEYRALLADVQP